jgi:hypothetical protein
MPRKRNKHAHTHTHTLATFNTQAHTQSYACRVDYEELKRKAASLKHAAAGKRKKHTHTHIDNAINLTYERKHIHA